MEINCVTAVSDDANRFYQIFHKRDAESGEHRVKFKLSRLYLPHRLWFQNRHTVNRAVLKKGEHETRHVSSRRGEGSGWRRLHEFEIARFFGRAEITFRHFRRELRRQRLIE